MKPRKKKKPVRLTRYEFGQRVVREHAAGRIHVGEELHLLAAVMLADRLQGIEDALMRLLEVVLKPRSNPEDAARLEAMIEALRSVFAKRDT